MTTAVSTATPRRVSTDGKLRIAIGILSLIGIGIGTYLTYTHYAKLNVLCLSSGGCETVQHSRWSKLDGIPVATLGLAGYIGIFISVWIRGELGRAMGFGLALVGFLFSMYLTYREAFTIKAYCQWCLGSAAILTILAILTTIRIIRTDPAAPPPAPRRKTSDRAERRRQMA
ncbi:MAG: vitamin K epoxide reductase family protein, partial [Solirubrobacteraceae bacterium]